MSILTRKQFTDYLHSSKVNKSNQVYLIYGDRLLVNKLLEKIVDTLLPKTISRFDTSIFDGNNDDDIIRLVNTINTFSLSQNGKLLILRNLKILNSKKSHLQARKKLKRFPEDNAIKKSNINKINTEFSISEKNIQNNFSLIENVIKGDLLDRHYLIFLSDSIDKNTSLFKTIASRGIIVDCSIPKNRTWSSQEFRKNLLRNLVEEILNENKKTIDEEAHHILYNMTNFDFDAFSKNFMRIIDYVGEKKHITVKDVGKLFEKTQKDHIFNLTNSILKKNLTRSLSILNSLLLDNIHPLQILTAILNKIRRLLLVKSFISYKKNKTWKGNKTFISFKKNTLEAIRRYDKDTREMIAKGKIVFGTTKEEKGSISSLILSEKTNPYTIYVTMLEADKLEQGFLLDVIKTLKEADKNLRSSRTNPKSVLELAVFSIYNLLKTWENNDNYFTR